MDRGKSVLVEKAVRRFRNGEPLQRLCKEYKMRWTKLRNAATNLLGEEEYRRTLSKNRVTLSKEAGRRRRERVPAREVLNRVKHGEGLQRLAKEYDVSWLTLKRRLVELIGKDRYKKIRKRIRRIRTKPHTITVGYGSPIAKQNGADSLMELEVKTLLEKYGIQFKYRQILEANGHCYEPDFIFRDGTILEVMGVNHEKYWKRCHEKLIDYLENHHKVLVVIMDYVTINISKYIPREVTVTKISEFKRNIETYAETLKAKNTAINKRATQLTNLFRATAKQNGCEFGATFACYKVSRNCASSPFLATS
jgi:hypothetical protein